MSADISVSCSPGFQINVDVAENVCTEFKDLLIKKYPQHNFGTGSGAPGIALTVPKANERSLGLEVIWVTSGGPRRAGVPLSTAFFDRNSDKQLRRRFYEKFLLENPLPF